MSIRGKSEKTLLQNNLITNKQLIPQSDRRVKMIYDRYRNGRSIIMDDLQYLWLMDPEGFEKISKHIVETNSEKNLKVETNSTINNEQGKRNSEIMIGIQNYNINKYHADTPAVSLKSAMESIHSLKIMLENMSDQELKDLLKNIYNEIELKKRAISMNDFSDWEDNMIEKLYHSYDFEKSFDISV